MKMNNDAVIAELGAIATIFICIMTVITFGITIGAWEASLWESDMEIVDYDGQWGEDIIVTYADGVTESVKGVSNNYWAAMSIRDDGSGAILSLQYCINAKIPTSDAFDTRYYYCDVSIVQDSIDFYQTTYTITDFVDVKANEWTRIITVPLNIQTISGNWNDGIYTVSFESIGSIESINVPDGRSLDIVIEEGIVSFLI